ncbi:hypothetical protein HHK36_009302 [Tetracentron sinense]|uniref:Complex III subunit VI n=1 Tax=Tetracentron sinense TaxID=13715 RepID=A0A835DKW7_TETSI|nr:hypothetical protein HHK36_009302 [Tetracentron sinense]
MQYLLCHCNICFSYLRFCTLSLFQYRADEEPVDRKKYFEDSCKPKCVKPLLEYQACVKRIQGDETDHKHCCTKAFCETEVMGRSFGGTLMFFSFVSHPLITASKHLVGQLPSCKKRIMDPTFTRNALSAQAHLAVLKYSDQILIGSSGTTRPGNGGAASEPTIFLHDSIKQFLQVGHDECDISHLSMHRTWNPWLHLGKILIRLPGQNSERHMTHSVSKPGNSNPAEYVSVGKVLRAFFLIPVLASRVAELLEDSEEAARLEHLNAHLMTEFIPNAQIRAQKRTEMIITTCAWELRSPM